MSSWPGAPTPLSETYANADPQTTTHPAAHNAVNAAVNTLRAQVSPLAAGPGGIIAFGTSQMGFAGGRVADDSWPSILSQFLGAEVTDKHVDGSVAAYDDTSGTGDGGWATVARYLSTPFQSAPYTSPFSTIFFQFGINDIIQGDPGDAGTYTTVTNVMRALVGLGRSASYFPHTHATVRKTGIGEQGAGSWATQSPAAGVDAAVQGTYTQTTVATDEIHIDLAADTPATAVWLYFRNSGHTAKSGGTGGSFTATAGRQALRPDSDVAGGSWTTSPYFSKLNETVADDSTTEVTSENRTSNGNTTGLELGFTNPSSTPGTDVGHFIRVRVKKTGTGGGNLDYQLKVAGSVIKTGTIATGLTTSYGTYTLALSTADVAAIGGNYNALTLNIYGNRTSGIVTDNFSVQVSWIEIEVPPASSALVTGDNRDRYIEWATAARASMTARRVPLSTAGAQEINLYISALRTNFQFQGYSIEAVVPPPIGLVMPWRLSSYAGYAGYPYVANIGDAMVTTLASTMTSLANEFTDGLVQTLADGADAILNKDPANFGADLVHVNAAGALIWAAEVLADYLKKFPRTSRAVMNSGLKRAPWHQRDPNKEPVRVATTGNITLSSAPGTIDGVTLAKGDRVLVRIQNTASENGIYVWNGGAPPMIRANDADTIEKLTDGSTVYVREGTLFAESVWVQALGITAIGTSTVAYYRAYTSSARVGLVQDIPHSHYFTSDGTIAVGDAVMMSTTTDARIISAATANSPAVIGVALSATTGAGQACEVAGIGSVVNVKKLSGTAVTRGALMATTTTAGAITPQATPANGTVLGKALAAQAAGDLTVWVYVTLT